MKKPNLKKNAPLIFTGLSLVGIAGTAFIGVRAGMEAEKILAANPDARTLKEKARLTWKAYILLVGSIVATGGCVVMSHKLSAKQIAALSSLAATGATTLSQYRDKVRGVIGAEEEEKLYSEAKNETRWAITNSYPHNEGALDDEDNPVLLWYDDYSGRKFRARKSQVIEALYNLNRRFNIEMFQTLNEFYRELPMLGAIPGGDEEGWSIDSFAEMTWDVYNWIDIHILEYPDPDTGEVTHGIVFDVLPTKEALSNYDYI